MSLVGLRETSTPARQDASLRAEWQALTAGAGVVSLSEFGVLTVEGRDRAAWLNNLITANVPAIGASAGAYALLLEGKGHVIADFVLLNRGDSFWLYSSRAAFETLLANLRRSIFRERVTLTDLSDRFGILTLQGPLSQIVIQKTFSTNLHSLNLPASQSLESSHPTSQSPISSLSVSPSLPFAQLPFTSYQLLLIRNPRAGTDGFDLIVPKEADAALSQALIEGGGQAVGPEALNIARVEAGVPWYGVDFDETMLALEARLDAFVAENKGCYPGQEVIARIRNLGHVNRLLALFQIDGGVVPSRGDLVFAEGNEVGWITSPVWSYAHDAPLALGYTRRESAVAGTRVQIAHGNEKLEARLITH